MLEVVLLLLTVAATVILIGGGILLPLVLTQAAETQSYFASKAGAAVGFLISGLLWRKLLTYYRYEVHTLRPIKEEKTATPTDGRETNEG
ncbi:MAG: hypothetical protein JNK19_00995 [Tabrizicola sp.]|nr:hypothetical protein [Tabrizicola sp.]